MKILFISKKSQHNTFLVKGLSANGFLFDVVEEHDKGVCLSQYREYDLIIIEDDNSGVNTGKIISKIRQHNIRIPVVLLLLINGIEARVDALINGFDDVVASDTPLIEISARMTGLIRRNAQVPNSFILKFGDLEIDTRERIVKRNNRCIPLRKKEYEVLEYMLHHPEQVLSRERLLQHIWPNETFSFTNTVDVHMSAIRKKIDKDNINKIIHTVHGIGYKISDNDDLY